MADYESFLCSMYLSVLLEVRKDKGREPLSTSFTQLFELCRIFMAESLHQSF